MRKDMNKVLCTRPRKGGGWKKKFFDKMNTPKEVRYFKGVKVDLSPKQESMKKRHRVALDSKELTDHIEPLHRYLLSKVGEPWDDVWSDICKVLKGNGLQAAHVKQHVKWAVDGIPHSGECFFNDEDWHSPRFGVVYVDENGIVQKNYRERRDPIEVNYVTINGLNYAECEEGWFQVELDWISCWPDKKDWDALNKRYMTAEELKEFYGISVRCYKRHSLNKKQLKALGLRKT